MNRQIDNEKNSYTITPLANQPSEEQANLNGCEDARKKKQVADSGEGEWRKEWLDKKRETEGEMSEIEEPPKERTKCSQRTTVEQAKM